MKMSKRKFEVIVIEDSDEENNEEIITKKNTQNRIIECYEKLTEKLNVLFSNHKIIMDDLIKWRMCMNPFRNYGFNYHVDDTTTKNKNENSEKEVEENKTNVILNDEKSCDSFITEDTSSQDSILNNLEDITRNSVDLENDTEINDEIVISEYRPYYLDNFNYILNEVIEKNKYAKHLFNEEDVKIIEKFENLSIQAKKLYIRLYQRKKQWFRCSKLSYPKISQDLSPFVQELLKQGYVKDDSDLHDLYAIFSLFSVFEVRTFANEMQLSKKINGKTKEEIVDVLLQHSRKQKTIFSFMKTKNNAMVSVMSKKAKKHLGSCIILNDNVAFVYARIFTYFSLTIQHYEDIMYNAGSNHLYHLLQVNTGDISYPKYNIDSTKCIFETREQFIEYTKVSEMEKEFDLIVEKKQYNEAYKIYLNIKEKLIKLFENIIEDGDKMVKSFWNIPSFLRCFSKEWLTVRLASKCIDILEKRKEYTEAIALINLLLSQNIFCQSNRGALYERLAIDYERYIKNHKKAIESIELSLDDPFVRSGFRLGLTQRFLRLSKSIEKKKLFKVNKISMEEITDPIEEAICSQLALDTSSGGRAVFVLPSSTDEKEANYSHVEQHVILHYQNHGYPQGLHGEGSTVMTIFMLLFWEIIFMDVKDVFQSSLQSSPLDLYRDEFYCNRKQAIDKRLNEISQMDEKELRESVEDAWKNYHGLSCVGVNWDLFENEEMAADLAVCLGSKVLSGISELFCKDLRRRRGGFPDLIVWNKNEKKCKIIEVKGPGDKLSTKQIVWLDVLNFLGAEATVCHVKGIGGKKLKIL